MKSRQQMNRNFIILSLLLFCFPLFAYEKSNKIDVVLFPSVSFDAPNAKFIFQYTINSSHSSEQEVNELRIHTSGSHFNPGSPSGWEYSDTRNAHPLVRSLASWYAGWNNSPEGRVVPPHGNVEAPPSQVKPGQTLSGFSFESSSLPGVVEFFAFGFIKLRTVEEVEADPYPPGHTFLDDAFKSKTVGPVPVADTNIDKLLERLISLKDSMPSYGWITNPGVINSLNVKLNAAKESIAKGNVKTATNQLNAFINELDAQRGKQVNENAWALLKANAEFLIYKLTD